MFLLLAKHHLTKTIQTTPATSALLIHEARALGQYFTALSLDFPSCFVCLCLVIWLWRHRSRNIR